MFTSDRNLYITTIGNNNNYMPHAHTSREIVAHRRNSERGRRLTSCLPVAYISNQNDAAAGFRCNSQVLVCNPVYFLSCRFFTRPTSLHSLDGWNPEYKTNFSCASYYISVFDATSLPSDKKDFPFSAGQMEKIMFHRLFDCMKVSGIVYRTYIRLFPLIAVSL